MRAASTIILLRDGWSGLEVLMVRRHLKSDFVGGAHVFPGGAVDPGDSVDESLCCGPGDQSASALLGISSGGLAFWVAAIRECFEEAGILMASDASATVRDLGTPNAAAWIREQRRRMQMHEIRFMDLIRDSKLKLAADRLHYWGHWITPEDQPRRYDTRFFLAPAPAGQYGAHDGDEVTESVWVSPESAIDKGRSGEWTLVLPTLYNLKMLARFHSVKEAEHAASNRRPAPGILPRLIREGAGIRIVLPGDAGYNAAATTTAASAEEIAAGSLRRIDEGILE